MSIKQHRTNAWRLVKHFPQTSGFVIAIQDQVISKNDYKDCILKDPDVIKSIGRKYRVIWEIIQHNTGVGHALTQGDYIHRHKKVANIDHQE